MNGRDHHLWRAVDQSGNILDILVQNRRNKKAAKRFSSRLLKGLQYAPRVIITDKLKSYAIGVHPFGSPRCDLSDVLRAAGAALLDVRGTFYGAAA